MKTLEEEALCYAETVNDVAPGAYTDFIAGATSKYVQIESIKEQMSLLSNLRCSYDDTYYIDLEYNRLERLLKELEDV